MGIKYAVNENFFSRWSPAMAYALGFWYADGSLEDAPYIRGKYVRVTSTDRQIIAEIRRVLGAKHPIVVLKKYGLNKKQRYLLRIGSHRLFDSLYDLGLRPNKSLKMKFPRVPKAYLSDFTRGYFDGDGWVGIETAVGKSQRHIIKRLCIAFTSGSKPFLEMLSRELSDAHGLSRRKVISSKRSYQLRYSTRDSITLFKYFYKDSPSLCLTRKYFVFEQYFTRRPERADYEARAVLKHGPVAKW